MNQLKKLSIRTKFEKLPLTPECLFMPRSTTEDWVEAIKVFIKDTVGNKNWQFKETCF